MALIWLALVTMAAHLQLNVHSLCCQPALGGQWDNGRNSFKPGAEASLRLTTQNGLRSEMEVDDMEFQTSIVRPNGSSEIVGSSLRVANDHRLLVFHVPDTPGIFSLDVVDGDGSRLPGSPFEFSVLSADIAIASCVGYWPYGSVLDVGETAYFHVKLYDIHDDPGFEVVSFSVTVNGDPAAISDLAMTLDGSVEVITFTPLIIGLYTMDVGSGNERISGSPFSFQIVAGNASILNSVAFWVDGVHSFRAGDLAAAKVLLRDIRNNTLKFSNGKTSMVKFDLSIIPSKTDTRTLPDPEFNLVSDFQTGFEFVYFTAKLSGYFTLDIGLLSIGSVQNSPLAFDVTAGPIHVPSCTGGFTSESTLQAGSKASVMVKLADQYGSTVYTGTYDFTVSVEGKVGASKFISDVNCTQLQPGFMLVTFTPTTVGSYLLYIGDGLKFIKSSPLPFTVTGGPIYIPFCTAEWPYDIDSFIAGELASVRVLLMDAFNNNVSEATGTPGAFFKFSVTVLDPSGSVSNLTNLKVAPDIYESGYVVISFTAYTSGVNTLLIGDGNQTIFNSPLEFTVAPGPLSILKSFLEWPYGSNDFQIGSPVKLIVNKRDMYRNPVPNDYSFDVTLYRTDEVRGVVYLANGTTYPIGDLKETYLEPRSSGKIMLEFQASEGSFQIEVLAGTPFQNLSDYAAYSLTYSEPINDTDSVQGSPAPFTTFVGTVDPGFTKCSGDGFSGSTVGGAASFDVQLMESAEETAYEIGANVSLRNTIAATLSLGNLVVQGTISPDLTTDGLYHIDYTTVKAGIYNITVTWTSNIICQGQAVMSAGSVVLSKSNVTGDGTAPRIARNTAKQIFIYLQDSYGNYVQGQRDRLRYRIDGSGGARTQNIIDIGTGYSTSYTIYDAGLYSITVSYDNTPLPGMPLKIQVLPETSFPRAADDTVLTWEEVSILIDVLGNDLASSPSAIKKLTGFSKLPTIGSVVLVNGKARYTPRRGYSGKDSFSYILTESGTGASATGLVFVSVRTEPPDFTYWPKALIAIEGHPVSTIDDFNGFYISYTNRTEVLTLGVKADHGHVYLPADALQLWHDIGYANTVSYNATTNTTSYSMTLTGTVDYLNKALEDLLYIGDAFYNGNDTLMLSVTNTNNTGDFVTIPVQVLPFNDPPFVLAPNYVIKEQDGTLKSLTGNSVAFNVKNPVIGITVGDPDASDVREDGRMHQLELMLEATSGSITIFLPESAASNVEQRLEGDHRWQPCLSATISNGVFPVVAQGVRFRGTIAECNIALSTITYNGTVDGEGLNVVVNDMGNFGCSGDCSSDISPPLVAQEMVIIFIAVPRSSWWAFMKEARIYGATVGSVGLVALLFICLMCAIGRRASRNVKRAAAKDAEEIEDDQVCDATRVYNPLWIPSVGAGEKREVPSAPNPLIIQQRQQELRQRIRDVELELESLNKQHQQKVSPTDSRSPEPETQKPS